MMDNILYGIGLYTYIVNNWGIIHCYMVLCVLLSIIYRAPLKPFNELIAPYYDMFNA